MAAMVLVAFTSCNSQGVTKKELKSEVDSVSYALGLSMANQVKGNFDEISTDLYMQGFKNGVDSTNILLKQENLNDIINTYFQKKQVESRKIAEEEALKKTEAEFADIKKASEDFLAANKSKEGVQTTASGLQYQVLKEGTGEKPMATSKVRVHYHGTSLDGKVFDSSVDRGEPYELLANQFVKGFTEGLLLMNVGSKYKFFIPQDLAYGAFPRQGGPIKPFEALVFEVELLDIIK